MSQRKRDTTIDPEDLAGFEARVQQEAEQSRIKEQATRWGLGVMLLGAATISVPALLLNDVTLNVLFAGVAIMLAGGLIRDPDRFERLSNRAIDALPWGKR